MIIEYEGHLECMLCHQVKPLGDPEARVASGQPWPECCGLTMRWIQTPPCESRPERLLIILLVAFLGLLAALAAIERYKSGREISPSWEPPPPAAAPAAGERAA